MSTVAGEFAVARGIFHLAPSFEGPEEVSSEANLQVVMHIAVARPAFPLHLARNSDPDMR